MHPTNQPKVGGRTGLCGPRAVAFGARGAQIPFDALVVFQLQNTPLASLTDNRGELRPSPIDL
jgi:hypothetical protein